MGLQTIMDIEPPWEMMPLTTDWPLFFYYNYIVKYPHTWKKYFCFNVWINNDQNALDLQTIIDIEHSDRWCGCPQTDH